jgi:hypothetical protein
MTLVENTAEGGTNGTGVTTANTGGTSGRAFDTIVLGSGAAIKFDNAQTAHGALSYHFTTGSSFVSPIVQWTVAPANSKLAMRTYIRFGVLPLGGTQIWIACGGGTFATSSANQFQIRDAGGVKWTSANIATTGVWYRIEMECQTGAASAGYIAGRYFLGDSTTPVDTPYASSTVYALSGVPTSVAFGGPQNFATLDMYVDDLALNTGTTTPIGPYVPAVPAFSGWGIPI